MAQETWGQQASRRVRRQMGQPETGPTRPVTQEPRGSWENPFAGPQPGMRELGMGAREVGREVGGAVDALKGFGNTILSGPRTIWEGVKSGVKDVARPFVQGLAGADADTYEYDKQPTNMPPRPPHRLDLPDPARTETYVDPMAVGSLATGVKLSDLEEGPPVSAAQPSRLERMRPGQAIVSGGMRPLPKSRLMDPTVFQSLNPEERESYARSMGQMQQLQQGEQAAMSPQDRANMAGAATDITDYDAATRGPQRARNQLAVQAIEWADPTAKAKREYEIQQRFIQYGLPQQMRGEYDILHQQLVNQGWEDKAAAEQATQLLVAQERTRQAQITADAGERNAAVAALSRGTAAKMNSPYYAPGMEPPTFDTYEPDLYNRAFGDRTPVAPPATAAPSVLRQPAPRAIGGTANARISPGATNAGPLAQGQLQPPGAGSYGTAQNMAQAILRVPGVDQLSPQDRRQYIDELIQAGHIRNASDADRAALYAAVGAQ